jgi:hypothetical protein
LSSLASQSLSIIKPFNDEKINTGSEVEIAWESTGYDGKIILSFSKYFSGPKNEIAMQMASEKSYFWFGLPENLEDDDSRIYLFLKQQSPPHLEKYVTIIVPDAIKPQRNQVFTISDYNPTIGSSILVAWLGDNDASINKIDEQGSHLTSFGNRQSIKIVIDENHVEKFYLTAEKPAGNEIGRSKIIKIKENIKINPGSSSSLANVVDTTGIGKPSSPNPAPTGKDPIALTNLIGLTVTRSSTEAFLRWNNEDGIRYKVYYSTHSSANWKEIHTSREESWQWLLPMNLRDGSLFFRIVNTADSTFKQHVLSKKPGK